MSEYWERLWSEYAKGPRLVQLTRKRNRNSPHALTKIDAILTKAEAGR